MISKYKHTVHRICTKLATSQTNIKTSHFPLETCQRNRDGTLRLFSVGGCENKAAAHTCQAGASCPAPHSAEREWLGCPAALRSPAIAGTAHFSYLVLNSETHPSLQKGATDSQATSDWFWASTYLLFRSWVEQSHPAVCFTCIEQKAQFPVYMLRGPDFKRYCRPLEYVGSRLFQAASHYLRKLFLKRCELYRC